jgi:chromosome segregation ATPase
LKWGPVLEKSTYTEDDLKKVFKSLYIEKKKVTQLMEKVQEIGRDRQSLQEALDRAQQRLQQEPTTVMLEDPALALKLEILQKQMSENRSENDAKTAQLTREINILHAQLMEKNEELGRVVKDNRSLADAKDQLAKTKPLMIALKAKLDDAVRENQKLAEAVSHLQAAAIVTDQEQTQLLRDEIKNLHQQLKDEKNSQRVISGKLDEKKQQIESQLDEAVRQIDLLKNELEDRRQQEIRQERGEYSLRDELNQRTEALYSSRQELERINTEMVLLRKQLEAASVVASRSQDELKGTKEALEKTKAELTSVYHRFNSELDHSKEEIDQIIEEKVALTQQVAVLQAESNSSKSKLDEVKGLFNSAQEQAQQLRQQTEKLRLALENREQRVESLKEFEYGFKKLSQQKNDLENNLRQEKNRVLQAQEKQKDLLNRLEERERALEQMSGDVKLFQESEEVALEKMNRLQLEVASLKKEKDAADQRIQFSRQSDDERFQQLQGELDQTRSLSKKYEVELKRRSDSLNEMGNELELIKQTLVRGIREAKEIENRFFDAVNEKMNLQKRLEQNKGELAQRKDEVAYLRDQIVTLAAEKERAEKKIEDLGKSVGSSEGQASALKDQLALLNTAVEVAKVATEEKSRRIESLQDEVNGIRNKFDQASARLEEMEDLRRRAAALEQELKSRNESVEVLQEDLTLQIKRYFELEGALKVLQDSKHSVDLAYNALKEEHLRQGEKLSETAAERGEAESSYLELKDLYQAKLQIIDGKNTEIEHLSAENHSLAESYKEAQKVIEDREQRILVAQQHLGKKVKENAQFHEQMESQKIKMLEMQNQVIQYKSLINELKNQQEMQKEQEKRLQDLLEKNMRAADEKINKWEEKYFAEFEKNQKSEREKDRVQEKYDTLLKEYHKSRGLLQNLSNYFKNPADGDQSNPLAQVGFPSMGFDDGARALGNESTAKLESSPTQKKQVVETQEDLFASSSSANGSKGSGKNYEPTLF